MTRVAALVVAIISGLSITSCNSSSHSVSSKIVGKYSTEQNACVAAATTTLKKLDCDLYEECTDDAGWGDKISLPSSQCENLPDIPDPIESAYQAAQDQCRLGSAVSSSETSCDQFKPCIRDHRWGSEKVTLAPYECDKIKPTLDLDARQVYKLAS